MWFQRFWILKSTCTECTVASSSSSQLTQIIQARINLTTSSLILLAVTLNKTPRSTMSTRRLQRLVIFLIILRRRKQPLSKKTKQLLMVVKTRFQFSYQSIRAKKNQAWTSVRSQKRKMTIQVLPIAHHSRMLRRVHEISAHRAWPHQSSCIMIKSRLTKSLKTSQTIVWSI